MECWAVGKVLSMICTDTPAKSLKGETLGSFSATCVERSADTGPTCLSMWRVSTFQEVMSISVTSVVRSLTPNKSGACIARVFTLARSQSECWCALHNENLLVLECNNLPLIQSKLNILVIVKASFVMGFSLKFFRRIFCSALSQLLV